MSSDVLHTLQLVSRGRRQDPNRDRDRESHYEKDTTRMITERDEWLLRDVQLYSIELDRKSKGKLY